MSKQSGQTLLALVLVMVIGSSYLLVRTFNSNTTRIAAGEQAAYKLKLAKQALIGYAASYPDNVNPDEGPGYLLCPDTNGDGFAETNCSGAAVGRFPWKTLELTDVYDASGQTLWYALSENYRYGPNKRIPLNSETPGQLNVDGVGDIVAILFAPGVPVAGQTRTAGSNAVSDFLDGENADGDADFITTLAAPNVKKLDGVYDANDSLVFNDRLVSISRAELMRVVERRVMGEYRQVLADYFTTYNAYPWLTTFADPKSSSREITGSADSGSTSTLLIDSEQDFLELGVRRNDIVYNTTDGSLGIVSTTPTQADRLTVLALNHGTENDFDEDDVYIVIVRDRDASYTGTASGGSGGLMLEDLGRDFSDLAIAPGDVLENLTDGSSGIIDSIASDTITVTSLTGGTTNQFSNTDSYLIRSNHGSHTGSDDTLTLLDANKNFTIMGVQVGDLLWNLTDDSMGRITAVATNTLTVTELLYGTDNDIDANDTYTVIRHEATPNVREGLLSFHEVGIPFQTEFALTWNTPLNNACSVSTCDGTDCDYCLTNSTELQEDFMNARLAGGTASYNVNQGVCVWLDASIAECYTEKMNRSYLSIDGRMTFGFNTDRITDSAAQFTTDGVKTGDIAQNYDDEIFITSGTSDSGSSDTTLVDAGVDFTSLNLIPYSFLIHNTSQGTRGLIADIIDADTIIVEPYTGSATTPITFSSGESFSIYRPRNAVVDYRVSQTQVETDRLNSYDPDFDDDEYYRIIPAGNSFSGTVDSETESGGIDTMTDSSEDFIAMGVEIGDVIHVPSRDEWGEITAVTTTTITTDLYGPDDEFYSGDSYTVYYDYVYSREYFYDVSFRGTATITSDAEVRTRDISTTNFSTASSTPFLTVIDYQEDGTSFTSTFTPKSAFSITDIKYSLADGSGDMPAWLIDNDWHKLVYVAFSSDDAPGVASVCTSGTDCLSLDVNWNATTATQDNKRALLVAAGAETTTVRNNSCSAIAATAQDRTLGTINNYFELDNCDAGDDIFSLDRDGNNFNDQVSVMATSP